MAITPGSSHSGTPDDLLVRRCSELAADGVDWLLVREKHRLERDLVVLTRKILEAVRDSGTRVLVAGRPQVALAAGAGGIHVGSQYGKVREARRVFAETWVICSCHSVADVTAARQAGVDLVLFAPVFGKTVHGVEVVPGTGLDALREACNVAGPGVPVLALGGVTETNAAACMGARASGIAAIRLFFGTE